MKYARFDSKKYRLELLNILNKVYCEIKLNKIKNETDKEYPTKKERKSSEHI